MGALVMCLAAALVVFCATAATASADSLPQCQPGLMLPVWRPQEGLTLWDRVLRGSIYFALLSYIFLGVSIGSDRFMGAIEVITSQERELLIRKKGCAEGQRVRVRVWNETIANLTLMALGSSAPEILLSIIEIVGKNFAAGDLGPGTIVGSAAYNLFVIMAICVYVIPDGETRRIRHLSVFFVTATWSVFAYIWMYMILAVISEGVVECWEALLTFLFFPATVLTAYVADRKLRICGIKRFRLHKNRVIVAAEGGDVDQRPDDEQRLEDEILEESSVTDPHHFAIILRDLKKRNSSATPEQLERMAVDELAKRTHKSKAFYRLQANKQLTGGVAQMHHRRSEQPPPEAVANVQQPSIRISLQPDHYTVLENVGQFEVTVMREGEDLRHNVSVFYTTEDGTAVAGSDYEGATGTVVFGPGETCKTITLRVIDDDIFEEDEHFYLHLTKAVVVLPNGSGAMAQSTGENVVALGPPATATIVILDDDHCGVFGFATESIEVPENVGLLRLEVVRSSGARGAVRLEYVMTEGTAKNERHFVQKSGTLVFENNEARKEIEIEIVEENCYEKNVSFFVELKSPKEESNEQILTNRTETDVGDVSDEEKIAMSGRPRLGAITKVQVVIRESDEFKNTVNKLVEQEGPSVGFSSWPQQFINAFRVKVDDDESEENKELTTCDYVTHFLTFFWKLIFAFVPPADMYSGYLCFTVSIIFIGVLTAVIGDLASHFGCTIGLKDSVTAVTFVALGTSVPDTFASKVAAIQDSTADNSVGNVTGSNAVNVFLGIGIAWSIAAFYHKWNRKGDFEVNAGNLAFCVTLFCTEAAVAIALLLLRRSKIIGGELGGPVVLKRLTSAIFLLLWIIYITMAALEAYGVIKGF